METNINKGITKECVNHTIDKLLYAKFREITKEKSINRSKLVENLITEWVEKNKI